MKKMKHPLMGCAACAAGMFTAFTLWQNIRVKTTEYVLQSQDLPSAFDGFRIVLLADIHSRRFGDKQEQLLSRVRAAKPDLILIAGDWMDARAGKISTCIAQARGLCAIAPVCGVYGNHELRRIRKTGQDKFDAALQKTGVQMLHTSGTRIERGGMYLNLIGVEDPAEIPDHPKKKEMMRSVDEMMERVMHGVLPDEFTILIAHRPEFFHVYAKYPIDLVCAGHAHGGQIRLPGIGGLFAPGQGLLPKYTGGKYSEGQTNMIVSRGLGGREAPIRILNMPEIVVLTLKAGES